jgi:enoyl-CoA hydratase/carnithine racemase
MSEFRRPRPDISSAAEPLLVSVEGAIARLTFNRPDKRNAMNPRLNDDAVDAVARSIQEFGVPPADRG